MFLFLGKIVNKKLKYKQTLVPVSTFSISLG